MDASVSTTFDTLCRCLPWGGGKTDSACNTALLVRPDGILSETFTFWNFRLTSNLNDFINEQRPFSPEPDVQNILKGGISVLAALLAGNNVVVDMVYAATKCKYVDRLGYYHGYRKVRRDAKGDDGRCWPQHAHNTEAYLGYMFDAGDHSLYER
jgi:hypothetical protein